MRLTSLISIPIFLILVSGCGSSGSSSLSPEQFVAKANTVCRQNNAKIGLLWKSGGTDAQTTGLRVASAADKYTAKLRALEPPSEQADAYARLIASYQRQASKLRKMEETTSGTIDVMLAALSVKMPDGTEELASLALPAEAESDRLESIRIGRSLGLNACTGSTSGGFRSTS